MSNRQPYVIGVAGGSGSGKTSFLKCLLSHFNSEDVSLVSQDDYYIPQGKMTPEENKLHNFDLPDCIDLEQFEKDVVDLLDFKTVYKKEYTFNNPKLKPKLLEIKPAPILILEGLFIYHYPSINQHFDYKIFIDADADIALERRIKRDAIERGYSEEDVTYKWINHVTPAYQEFLLPYRSQCNEVIENSKNELEHLLKVSETLSTRFRAKLKR